MTIHHDKMAYGRLASGREELSEDRISQMLRSLNGGRTRVALCVKRFKEGDVSFVQRAIEGVLSDLSGKADIAVFGGFIKADGLSRDYEIGNNAEPCGGAFGCLARAAKLNSVAVAFGYEGYDAGGGFRGFAVIGRDGRFVADHYTQIGERRSGGGSDDGRSAFGFEMFGTRFAVCFDIKDIIAPQTLALSADALLCVNCGRSAEELLVKCGFCGSAGAAESLLLVNALDGGANGGAAIFSHGKKVEELAAGEEGAIIAELNQK